MWWVPVHTQSSRPLGDGVKWRVHYTRVIDEDEEMPAQDSLEPRAPLLNSTQSLNKLSRGTASTHAPPATSGPRE